MTQRVDELVAVPSAQPTGVPIESVEAPSALDIFERRRYKKQRSLWNNAWRQFRHHRLAVVGLCVFCFIAVACLIGPLIWPHAIDDIDFSVQSDTMSMTHPMGTD